MTDGEASAAGWRPDPTWRYEFRWHNGTTWTADVSVNGQRFVDPLGVGPTPSTAPHSGAPFPGAPSGPTPPPMYGPHGYTPRFGPAPRNEGRGMAIASFIVAICSAFLGWVPFVFVVAAMGAVTALIFGVVSVRATRRAERGPHGMAIAGLVLSVVALGLCVLGFQFTRVVMDELDDLATAGAHRVAITECSNSGRIVTIEGRLTNLDETTQTFIVEVTVATGSSPAPLAIERLSTGMVEPGETDTFTANVVLPDSDEVPTSVTCTVSDVRGPSLFDPVE